MDKNKTILIAEDENALAHTLSLKLTNLGFKVLRANDGEEALKYLADGGIDLMILDLIMPKLNGFEVLAEMRRLNNHTPVVVASNLGQPEDFAKIKALGVADYFVKSEVSIKDLVSRVATIIS